MFLLLLAAAAAAQAQTPIDAERAFAAAARKDGQWTAFLRFATQGATMFTPKPVTAQDYLKDRKDPPRAIAWSPTASFVSCDGMLAANTGEWRAPGGVTGYFSTIWIKQADGAWKWTVDGGDDVTPPRAPVARPTVRKAACKGEPTEQAVFPPGGPGATGFGHSPDGTLQWSYQIDGAGARVFSVTLWDGARMATVIDDHIPVRPPSPTAAPPTP